MIASANRRMFLALRARGRPRGGVHPAAGNYGTYKTVKARFWPWLSGKGRQKLSRCSLFARMRFKFPPVRSFAISLGT